MNALYFPYINAPKSPWLMKVLLYWGRVNSIVPYDYAYNPENLEPHMRQLLTEELIVPILPMDYIDLITNFEEPFLKYVERYVQRQNQRYKTLRPPSLIHIEKIGEIGNNLEKMGVAQRKDFSWYEVEEPIATAFMAYLATVLGNLEEINAAPVTGEFRDYMALVNHSGTLNSRNYRIRRIAIRKITLDNILPCPQNLNDVQKLAQFKSKHSDLLQSFRQRIEGSAIDIANIEDAEARNERTKLTINELQDDIEQITEVMKSKWRKITLGTLTPIIAAGSTILGGDISLATGLSLAGAAYQAISSIKTMEEIKKQPLAYAAFTRIHFK